MNAAQQQDAVTVDRHWAALTPAEQSSHKQRTEGWHDNACRRKTSTKADIVRVLYHAFVQRATLWSCWTKLMCFKHKNASTKHNFRQLKSKLNLMFPPTHIHHPEDGGVAPQEEVGLLQHRYQFSLYEMLTKKERHCPERRRHPKMSSVSEPQTKPKTEIIKRQKSLLADWFSPQCLKSKVQQP